MKLLYGTKNPAKLQAMREKLEGLDLEIIGLNDLNLKVENVDENGNNPLDNARIKANAYNKATGIPTFSCDSGLYIRGLADEEQPGVHIRRVNGRELNDDEMIEHYTSLAARLGGAVSARYKNAVVLILDENNVFEYDGDDISSVEFLLTSKPHPKRTPGFPLDSISLEVGTKKYYKDLETDRKNDDNKLIGGFREFFCNVLSNFY